MAASTQSDDDIITGINVTPLVDITLVLLIIFMVTAKLVMAQAMPLDLPKAATAGETQTVFTVSIDLSAASSSANRRPLVAAPDTGWSASTNPTRIPGTPILAKVPIWMARY